MNDETISQSYYDDGYKIIKDITSIFGSGENSSDTISEMLEKIRKLYNFRAVRLIEKDGTGFKITYNALSPNQDEIFVPDYGTAYIGNIPEDGYFVISKDTGYYNSETKKFAEKAGYSQCICVPVIYEGSPAGGFELMRYGSLLTKPEIESAVTVIKVLISCMEASNGFLVQKRKQSKHDTVTGLAKYEYFMQKLEAEMSKYSSENTALVHTDMYEFKFVNEKYGFEKGNEILKTIANILESDENILQVGRIYSDNFIYVIKYSDDNPYTTVTIVENIHKEIIKRLSELIPDIKVLLYSGIFLLGGSGISAATATADAALAHKIAKQNGSKMNIVLFEPSMMNAIRKREELNNKLDDAIKRKNIVVYYQPKISCETEKIVGGEALVRWIRDDGTFIYPDEFIPAFEKSGNIIKLDYYVYKEVFAFLRRRLDLGLPVVPISVNVSRVHLRDNDITRYIRELFDEYKIPPELLEFEITENIYMSDTENAKKFMDFCKSQGVYISMDDFGSGFSSLNMVNTLPVDILKLDRQFVRNHELTETDKIVIECVVSMAKKLKMKVICEGVETKSQSEFLKEIQCDMIQGYYYGKPMNEHDFENYIMAHC